MRISLGFALFVCLFSLGSAQTLRLIRPSQTDSAITTEDEFHYTYITTAARNKLFLFFPGTGGLPQHYQLVLRTAANLGFHAIGLRYPNAIAINDVCALTLDTTCHRRARLEILDGTDRHPTIAVNRTNSIENRLIKLLKYLRTNYPAENWQQYLTNDSVIVWNKMIVSGHSQGGGHAGIIGKFHDVAGVVMFAAMDWLAFLNRNADWITMPGQTPASRLYGFTHYRDASVEINKQITTWRNYGMLGSLVNVDTTSPPFANSHTFTTFLPPAFDTTNFHGSVAVSVYTPLATNGTPVYAPLWEYMMRGGATSGVAEKENVPGAFRLEQNYPNPFNPTTKMSFVIGHSSLVSLKVFDVLGREVATLVNDELSPGTYAVSFDATDLPSGVYIYRLSVRTPSGQAGEFVQQRKMMMLR